MLGCGALIPGAGLESRTLAIGKDNSTVIADGKGLVQVDELLNFDPFSILFFVKSAQAPAA